MTLLVTLRETNYCKAGEFFEEFSDGVQRAEVETVDGRLQVKRNIGLIFPKKFLGDNIRTVLGKGMDYGRRGL